MLKKISIPILLIVAGLATFSFRNSNDQQTKNEIINQLIVQSLNTNHYDPFEVNDDFSKRVMSLYLDRLDYSKRYFTQSDVDRLMNYETKVDDQIKQSEFTLFDLSVELLDKRLAQVKTWYKEILIKPFDFNIDETIELDPDKMDWAKDEEELKERWRKTLKYAVMSRINTKMNIQEGLDEEDEDEKKDNSEEDEGPKTFEELEEDARQKVMKTYTEWERRVDKLDVEDRRAVYFNSIANTYDPHTSYFPPRDKENFDIQMSGRLEGIGATLQEKEGYVRVVSIVPGSPSYRQGELAEEDIILKVGQGDKEPVDIVDMPLDDAVQLIRGKKGTEVRLTCKKTDGTVKVISIIRDVVILSENYAKSVILENKEVSDDKVGYIKLPKFYADFQRTDGRSCSKDVAEEIRLLKEQGITSLILDLRNNGGGSLMDVVSMAGLFIKEGPIVQVKGRYGAPRVLDDTDEKVQWDGPLVVMVNSSSASASEIMAAAVQDYKRGIIVGTPTYGKGTVQRFYDLDRFIRNGDDIKPLGQIKLTTQKFYRINGGATQLKGVTPDVILPDNYFYIDRGEKENEYALEWDEIQAAKYGSYGLKQDDYSKVRRNSRDRVKANATFDKVLANAERLKRLRDVKVKSLNFETFRNGQMAIKEEGKKYKKMMKPIDGLEITNLPADVQEFEADSVLTQMNDEWVEKIQKDIYINEAIAVLGDME